MIDFLCFSLKQGHQYAVDILDIEAIVRVGHITAVPGTFPTVKGMFSYRGEIIPAVDLSMMCMGVPNENQELTAIVMGCKNTQKYGLLVDEVGTIVRGEIPLDVKFVNAKDLAQMVMSNDRNLDTSSIELF